MKSKKIAAAIEEGVHAAMERVLVTNSVMERALQNAGRRANEQVAQADADMRALRDLYSKNGVRLDSNKRIHFDHDVISQALPLADLKRLVAGLNDYLPKGKRLVEAQDHPDAAEPERKPRKGARVQLD